jgi:hypothetical protein
MIRPDDEVFPLEVGSQLQYGPDNRQTLLLRRGVIALRALQTSTPIYLPDVWSPNLLLEQKIPNLFLGSIGIENEESFRTR